MKPSKKPKNKNSDEKSNKGSKPNYLIKKINITQGNENIPDDQSEGLNPEVVTAEQMENEDDAIPTDNPEVKDADLENHLTEKQIRFAKYYTSHHEVFGNGTRSYAHAYGYYELCKADPLGLVNGAILKCQVGASRLLRNVMICRYIRHLSDLSMSEDSFNKEVAMLALQHDDKHLKLGALNLRAKTNRKLIEKTKGKIPDADKQPFTLIINKIYDTPQPKGKKKYVKESSANLDEK